MAAAVVGTRSTEEMARIQAFKLPNFKSPYPSKINIHVKKVKAEIYDWVKELGVDSLYSPERLQAFIDEDIPDLPLRVYVDAGEKEALWYSKYFLWNFVLDDHLDVRTSTSEAQSASLLLESILVILWSFPDSTRLRQNLVEYLDKGDLSERDSTLKYVDAKLANARLRPGTVYDTSSPEIHPLIKMWREVWEELAESMPSDFMHRFGETTEQYMLCNGEEMRSRNGPNPNPSVDEYIAMRRHSIGMLPCMVIIDYTDNVHTPDEVYYLPEMQDLIMASTDFVLFHNDLWSFKKEIIMDDKINLVYVLSHERGCTYQEAGKILYQMLLNTIVSLDKASEDVRRVTPPEHQHAVSKYIKGCQYWVSGTFDWHRKSKRYPQYE